MLWQTAEGKKSIETKQAIISWSTQKSTPIHRIDFTAGVTKHFGVFVFYKTDAELIELQKNNCIKKIETEICKILAEKGYVEIYSEGILFEFDTAENVKKNYKGNYFFRLM